MGTDLSYKNTYELTERNDLTTKEQYNAVLNGSMKAYNLMHLSRILGGIIAQYEVTDSLKYLDEAYDLCLKAISRTQVSKDIEGNRSPFLDKYKSWINLNPDYKTNRTGGEHLTEISLFESYFLRYMAKLLHETSIIASHRRTEKMRTQYGTLMSFVSYNGWEKWYTRGEKEDSCYYYLFRNRTHMTSHWALVALYMSKLDFDVEKKVQYDTFLTMYNDQLRKNLITTKDGAYRWNMTWDYAWPISLNCNPPSDFSIIQDAAHGDHVVTYVIEAYEMGCYWNEKDIKSFARTLRLELFNREDNFFYADLDGNIEESLKCGIEYADGFIKLGRYDKRVLKCFEKARLNNVHNFNFDDIQYVAEFKLAQKYLSE